MASELIRVQKLLADAGVSSRRAAERLIEEGRVTVDGVTARLGCSAKPDAVIRVDGKPVISGAGRVYIMLNKPRGYITSMSDPQGRKTVADLIVTAPERIYPVGRLDFDSDGLLIMTNDGELAHRLMHPRYGADKTYTVSVRGDIENGIEILKKPVTLDDGITVEAKSVERKGPRTIEIVIREGRNREIRRMCNAAGLQVRRLTRTAECGLKLGGLSAGDWRYLTPHEVRRLKSAVGDKRAQRTDELAE